MHATRTHSFRYGDYFSGGKSRHGQRRNYRPIHRKRFNVSIDPSAYVSERLRFAHVQTAALIRCRLRGNLSSRRQPNDQSYGRRNM